MYRRIIYLCILTVCSASGTGCSATIRDFDNSYILESQDKILAFVGRKVQVVEFDPAEDDPETLEGDDLIIHMDAGFKARYEVLEVVHGQYSGRYVDFKSYDHYGFPPFAEKSVAMLYLLESGGKLFHWKYQWDEVHPTKNSRFAACGDPYLLLRDIDKEKVERRPPVLIDFDPPVTLRISSYRISDKEKKNFSEERIRQNREFIEAYFTPPFFEIHGDHATCRMGAYTDELFRLEAETVIYWRFRREACERKLGFEKFYPLNSPEYDAVSECAADLKARGVLE